MSEKIQTNVKPELLTWARETAGLSIGDAARKVHVNADHLAKWERGDSRPMVGQLCRLADVYKRPLGVFFLDHPPREEALPPDFRRSEPTSNAGPSPELRLAIRTAHLKRRTALELLAELGEKAPRFVETATLGDDPEDIGVRLRATFGLDGDDSSGDARQRFNQRRTALEAAGLLVFQAQKVGVDEMRGFSLPERPLPVVVVNIKDSVSARSFSLFHEVAHVLLGNGGLCNFEEDDHTDHKHRVEVFCNHVAGATLVPRDKLLGRSETPKQLVHLLPDDAAAALAKYFGVSQEVVLRRLVTLRRLPLPFYLKQRDEMRRRSLALPKKTGGFAPPATMAVASNGRYFTKLILEAYAEEKIGTSDILELLGVRQKHLKKISESLTDASSEEAVES
jgi:Zn-dependent peptidase ImmA (M78 family)